MSERQPLFLMVDSAADGFPLDWNRVDLVMGQWVPLPSETTGIDDLDIEYAAQLAAERLKEGQVAHPNAVPLIWRVVGFHDEQITDDYYRIQLVEDDGSKTVDEFLLAGPVGIALRGLLEATRKNPPAIKSS